MDRFPQDLAPTLRVFLGGCAGFKRALDAGVLSPLERLIEEGDSDSQLGAGECLRKIISRDHYLVNNLHVVKFVKALVPMYENVGDPLSDSAHVVIELLYFCCEISDPALLTALDVGWPKRLVPLLGRSRNESRAYVHWRLVEEFARQDDGQQQLLDAGIVDVLVKHCTPDYDSLDHVTNVIAVGLSASCSPCSLTRAPDEGFHSPNPSPSLPPWLPPDGRSTIDNSWHMYVWQLQMSTILSCLL
jgi:hypothetical protein